MVKEQVSDKELRGTGHLKGRAQLIQTSLMRSLAVEERKIKGPVLVTNAFGCK